MEYWISLISDLGFPMAIALFQMFRLDKTLQELTDEIKKMSTKIENVE